MTDRSRKHGNAEASSEWTLPNVRTYIDALLWALKDAMDLAGIGGDPEWRRRFLEAHGLNEQDVR